MVTFFYLLQGTMDLMYNIAFFQLIFTFFFSTFCKELQASGVAWFMATFLYLIFLLFKQVNFCKELRTSGSGWLHDSILSPPSFLGRIKDLKCRMVTFVYLISTFFFQHFLPGIISLRCRMVTFFYLSFTVLPSFSNTFCKEPWTSGIG